MANRRWNIAIGQKLKSFCQGVRSSEFGVRSRLFAKSFAVIAAFAFYFVLSTFNTQPTAAAINEQLTFQGRLRTSAKAIVPDGDYHLEFKIYEGGDGNLGGGDETLAWTETRSTGNLVRVENGYFNVRLGEVTPFNSDVDWSNDTLHLSINVGGDGGSASWDGEMDPFIRLTSTPYAFEAKNSDLLDGRDSSEFIQNTLTTQTANLNIQGADSETPTAIIESHTSGVNFDIFRVEDRSSGSLAFHHLQDLDNSELRLDGKLVVNVNKTFDDIAAEFNGTVVGADAVNTDEFTTLGQLNAATGGGTKVASLNSLTDDLTLQGTANEIEISDDGTSVITVGLPEDVTIGNNLTVTNSATFNGNITVAANQSLRLTGSDTFPGAPSEGEIYFRSDQGKLYVYGGGEWKDATKDSKTATVTIAASDSSAAAQASADYVTDGTDDQVEINQALTAVAGGLVYIHEGTYTLSDSVSIPSNSTLAGASADTLIKLKDSFNADIELITNSNHSGGNSNINIRNLTLDGNGANNTNELQYGILFDTVNSSSIENITLRNFNFWTISFSNTSESKISNIYAVDNNNSAIQMQYGDNNILTESIFFNNSNTASATVGIYDDGSVITNNIIRGSNVGAGMTILGSNYVVSSNTFSENSGRGLILSRADNSTISDNIFYNNLSDDLVIGGTNGFGFGGSSNNIITGNNFYDNKGYAFLRLDADTLGDSTNNIISSNTFTHSGSLGVADYAISITSTVTETYLTDNTFTNTLDIIDDSSTTIYAGQTDNSGNWNLQPAGTIDLNTNTNIDGDLSVTGAGSITGNLTVGGSGAFTGTVSGADAVNTDEFTTLGQLNSATGNSTKVASLNSLTGGLSLQGTANEIEISDNGTDTLTVGLPDDVTIGNDLTVTNNAIINGSVAIGTANPQFTFHSVTESANFATLESYSGGNVFLGRRANGSSSAPLAVNGGDLLTQLGGRGYDGSSFSGTRGAITINARGDWTATNQGATISFFTTKEDTTTLTETMRLSDDGKLGLGTGSPGGDIHLVREGASFIVQQTYGGVTSYHGQRANGTKSSPTALTAGDIITQVAAQGYDGGDFSGNRSAVSLQASQNWSATNQGTSIKFYTTENNTTSMDLRMTINDSGNVGIGTDSISSRLQVAGNVLFNDDSTEAFRIQNAGATDDLVRADTINRELIVGGGLASSLTVGAGETLAVIENAEIQGVLRIGDGTDRVETNSNNQLRFFGNARNEHKITLSPEYPGMTLTPDGVDNLGELTSDFCSGSGRMNINTAVCTGANDEQNYFSWTTTEATAQDYDIYVHYQVPSNFDELAGVTMNGWRSTASDSVNVAFYNPSDGVQCATESVATANTTWTTQTVDMSSCVLSAGDMVVMKIKMTATDGNYARPGNIELNYRSKF